MKRFLHEMKEEVSMEDIVSVFIFFPVLMFALILIMAVMQS
jgi:hypothetical protein